MLSLVKRQFYQYIPSAYASAYIRLHYLRVFLKRLEFRNALDAGCGPDLFSFYVAERFPTSQVTGYDISSIDIDTCNQKKLKKKIENITFKPVVLRELNETQVYDFIFSIDVLEHIRGNLVVLKNIYNALEPGGIFYLAMPYEPGHRYLLPRRYNKDYIDWAKGEHVGEQYSLNTISKILSQLGFDIFDSRYTFSFWGKLAWELDMLTEKHPSIQRLLKPLIFVWGYMDTLWKNGPGSYAIRVIAKK
jgi:SAM-dependent methyltransferase